MKANRGLRPFVVLPAAALAMLAASCTETRIIPAPTPRPVQRPVQRPIQRPAPRPAPLPPARPTMPAPTPSPRPAPPPAPSAGLDWRLTPITPGTWNWGVEAGQSVARFAGGALVLRCDRTRGTVVLRRAGTTAGPEPMTISTTSTVRTLSATPQAGPTPALVATLAARDPLLDAMIFSRGRFAVEAPGLAPLYVPSWPEVARVIEDCR